MPRSLLIKLAISLPLLAALLLLDQVPALEGLPLLALALGLGLLIMEAPRVRLRARGRANLAMLPFMAAALVLLLAFCKGRQMSQAALFVITIGMVFDILMVALAAIGEVTKRGARGLVDFLGLACAGLAAGCALSLIFLVGPGRPGGVSLAGP